ncbi:MAG: glutamine synthetase III [Oscillospiraceae bacterium]|jgi:glutamine synthetase|nr:glutamine synthetase III [Oscillospiraceae bacterium]
MAFPITEAFGRMVFSDQAMRDKLPLDIYRRLRRTMQGSLPLDPQIADAVANAMKEWAVERGATHYTHWFQPMNGITAEKHDSFLRLESPGRVILDFSGKELIQGEPDASSFPSGGLRASFEARGYTAWDPTSYAFIKENTLCIPTAYCSYNGQALDKKTPLLRAMEALNRQAIRLLRALGDEKPRRVLAMVGAEQEYFLMDKAVFDRRKDLLLAGRTLFGARPPKGQEMEDHYFGSIKPRVAAFMRDLDEALWELGVPAKTEHNETAPGQHELACVHTTVNIASDHNQLVMELLQKVAGRHGLACLLHEKPFAGVNGSGKHINWSLETDDGQRLLEPGKTPREHLRFLLMLSAVMRAVDDHQDLLRIAAASPGNDHRLGAGEAPPAIVSLYMGEAWMQALEMAAQGGEYEPGERAALRTGVDVLPQFAQDTADRNRTSPFAFTGNKFEFRMPGAAQSVAEPCIILNTIMAESFRLFADALEGGATVEALIEETYAAHRRILFGGNNYAPDWREEAARRGLLHLRTTNEALARLTTDENIALFGRHQVLTDAELRSRQEILLTHYSKVIHIEALTMLDMARQAMLPAAVQYAHMLCEAALSKRTLFEGIAAEAETGTAALLSGLCDSLYRQIEQLDHAVMLSREHPGAQANADYHRDAVLPAMMQLRATADQIELHLAEERLPYPSYVQMLFSLT